MHCSQRCALPSPLSFGPTSSSRSGRIDLFLPSAHAGARTHILLAVAVHPRPDQRHIRPDDVDDLAKLLANEFNGAEYNIEGNPFQPPFMEIVCRVKPTQCTLVPDLPDAFTSDQGWNIAEEGERLIPIIQKLKEHQIRVSLFMDAAPNQMKLAKKIGADRVELYTEPYATAFREGRVETVFLNYAQAAQAAQAEGLGVNAGHDLNLENLSKFCMIPNILEVSIGHALMAEALEMGLSNTVKAYLDILSRT